jgi:iron complex transport system substrate-binding protein
MTLATHPTPLSNPMNRRASLQLIGAGLTGCLGVLPRLAFGQMTNNRTGNLIMVDDANRSIALTAPAQRVLAAGAPAAVFSYAIAPSSLLGWPRALRPNEKPYLHPSVRDLPGTGLLTGRGGEVNLETILRLRPDLIVDIGSTAPVYVDLANRIQRATGIPVALLSGRFEDSAKTFSTLSRLMGQTARGDSLAARTAALLDKAKTLTESLSIGDRPSVYLARGVDGLETASPGSINGEIIEYAGGFNALSALGPAPRSIVRVSMETLYRLNPQVIVTWDELFYRQLPTNPLWADLQAVKAKQVYLSPIVPFGWIDRPPSVNRLIGLRWLQQKLHPTRFNGQIDQEVQAFFKDFYAVALSTEQVRGLLQAI